MKTPSLLTLLTAASLLAASPLGLAQTAPADCSAIEVTGLKPNQGHVMLAVYGSAEQFFKKTVWVSKTEAKGKTAMVPMCGVTAREIAVTAFQDLNGNDKMDFNALNLPTEPYGASGKPPRFSAPTWDTSKVTWPPAPGKTVLVKF